MNTMAIPAKTREFISAIADSRRWNDFPFRDGDIVVSTWAKSGTTWTQQIVSQLLNGGKHGIFSMTDCPWVDMRLPPFDLMMANLEAQTGRRNLKTHLPVDAIVFSPEAKYLYVGRDTRDVVWSAYNHQSGYTDEALMMINANVAESEARIQRPDMPISEYYDYWIEHDGPANFGLTPFWEHVQSWYDIRHLPNVMMVHYADLKADLPGQIRGIAEFLEIPVTEASFPAIVDHCGFEYMRHAGKAESTISLFADGADTFFNKGTNGRWRDVLTADQVARCDERAAEVLSPDCAHWLKTGALPD